MPTVWVSLRKSLQCKSEPSDVHDPTASANPTHNLHLGSILTKKPARSGCSRSIANLKDVVIHGSKRHSEQPPSCSPRSIASSEFLHPIAHDVVLSSDTAELKITAAAASGLLRPSAAAARRSPSFRGAATPPRKPAAGSPLAGAVLGQRSSSAAVACNKCGEQFGKVDAAEAHHFSFHAVTELAEGDSSRKIVEIICRTGWAKSENSGMRIERVLKVNNMQKTLARFEEHRETVKLRASKLPKKHPRCLADGNELLRFHGATVGCSLGISGNGGICDGSNCGVCRIIRRGFGGEKRSGPGVFTAATSARALGAAEGAARKALMVCRVIAGRVHRPVEKAEEMAGFDSLAGKVGLYANIEELYLFSPQALLPCFVVICKP
ncbi:uncharacterized protein LOC144716469 [Wolffia australiana]